MKMRSEKKKVSGKYFFISFNQNFKTKKTCGMAEYSETSEIETIIAGRAKKGIVVEVETSVSQTMEMNRRREPNGQINVNKIPLMVSSLSLKSTLISSHQKYAENAICVTRRWQKANRKSNRKKKLREQGKKTQNKNVEQLAS